MQSQQKYCIKSCNVALKLAINAQNVTHNIPSYFFVKPVFCEEMIPIFFSVLYVFFQKIRPDIAGLSFPVHLGPAFLVALDDFHGVAFMRRTDLL